MEGLSSRKLVLETAYFNVLTAYSTSELLDAVERFPRIDAVVAHAGLEHMDVDAVSRKVREAASNALLVLLTSTNAHPSRGVDAVISSHDPQALLAFLQEKFGNAKQRI